MIRLIGMAAALGLVAICHVTGLFEALNLSHPFWHDKATLVGAAIGIVLALGLGWLKGKIPDMARALLVLMGAIFAAALISTWYAARHFINSADYEPFAGMVWYFGYHTIIALFVVLIASYLPHLSSRA